MFSRPLGVLAKNRKYQGTCELYHIERCVDPDCYWWKKSNYTDVSSSIHINSNTYRPLFGSFTNSTLGTNLYLDDYSAVRKTKQIHKKYKRRWIHLNEWRFRSSKISKSKSDSGCRVIYVYRKELKNKGPSSIIENASNLNYYHEYTRPLRVYQGRSLIKPVYVTHRQMRTSDYELSQVEAINLSSFDLRPIPFNATNNKIKDY